MGPGPPLKNKTLKNGFLLNREDQKIDGLRTGIPECSFFLTRFIAALKEGTIGTFTPSMYDIYHQRVEAL